MNIIIFGSTGSLGRVVVKQALNAGHTVTAFTRNRSPLPMGHENLTTSWGDVLDAPTVANAVKGHDAVICCLGAGRKGGIRANGTANIVAAMEHHGVPRFICQSTLGAGDSVGNLNFLWRYVMFGILLRPAFADHQKQEEIVRASNLDWTIVRPAAFTDGPMTGRYQHGFPTTSSKGLALKISRADIAHFIVDQIGSETYLHRAPGLSY